MKNIRQQYLKAWNSTIWSINNIEVINKVSNGIYDLKTEFVFIKKNGDRRTVKSTVRFVFDTNLKIIETFNL